MLSHLLFFLLYEMRVQLRRVEEGGVDAAADQGVAANPSSSAAAVQRTSIDARQLSGSCGGRTEVQHVTARAINLERSCAAPEHQSALARADVSSGGRLLAAMSGDDSSSAIRHRRGYGPAH